jgi:DNA-binding MarR family transcriptional regulator
MPYPERLTGDDDAESTIIVSESDARDAVRLLGLLTDALDKKDEEVADSNSPGQISRYELRLRARVVINSRRHRFRFFKRSMFGEPAWDMLLVLYITEPAEGSQSISRLAELVETPLSTAVRWIDYLEREKLVEREPHPTDKRVIFIRLSEKGREQIDGYLCGQPWVPAER